MPDSRCAWRGFKVEEYYAGLVPLLLPTATPPGGTAASPFIPHSMEGVNAFWVLYPQHIVVFVHLNPYIYSKAYR